MNKILKDAVKNIFSACGLEIRRKYTGKILTPRTWAQVLDHISELGFKPQTVIDVGVASGTFALYRKFPEARHILIEPLKEFEEDLKFISLNYNAEYIVAAAGAKKGNTIINVHPDLVGSSIFKETEGSYVDGITREVPMITIDDLCQERKLKHPYLIKIDVQGAELMVLEGAASVLQHTEVIILEVSFFNCILGCPLLCDVVTYMKRHDFVVYDIFHFNYRPLDKALCQVDMMFVKESGVFRKNNSFATFEQRKKQFADMLSFVNDRKIAKKS